METKNNEIKNISLNEEKYILLDKPKFFNWKLNKTQNTITENKNLEDKNNIWLKNKNTNSTASTTQNSHNSELKQNNSNKNFRCFEKVPEETEWFYRYNRNCYIKSGILDEDELYFKEHIENLTKKNKFNFDDLKSSEKISIY